MTKKEKYLMAKLAALEPLIKLYGDMIPPQGTQEYMDACAAHLVAETMLERIRSKKHDKA